MVVFCPVNEVMQADVQHPLSTACMRHLHSFKYKLLQLVVEVQGSHCQGTLTSMPETDHAAQLHCIGWAPACQMREMVQQLAITIRPVEHMPHHLYVIQLQVTSIVLACSEASQQ